MKFVQDIKEALQYQWPGNEFRVLDEKGNEYRATLFEEEDDVTYMKVELINEVHSS